MPHRGPLEHFSLMILSILTCFKFVTRIVTLLQYPLEKATVWLCHDSYRCLRN